MIEQKAYRDTWGKGLDSYLEWMSDTLTILYELLADDGSIYVHMDVHRGPYIKLLLDEIFGIDNFRNEIAWYYYNKMHDSRKKLLPKAFDQILYYVKNRTVLELLEFVTRRSMPVSFVGTQTFRPLFLSRCSPTINSPAWTVKIGRINDNSKTREDRASRDS